ncbi:MAG: VWA domain-containing protein [Thermoanaerobaculia bacterium]|nr:VWA domain-containing protein [Thermoanaerobaculia bacterium]
MKRLSALATVLLASTFAGAQQPAQPAPKPPPAPQQPMAPVSESVTVSVTNIEVVVTDSKGNRVSGLTREDFEVKQDGVPQPITNFYAVTGGKVLLEDGKTVSIEEPAAATELPSQLKTRYVFYIDNLNIQPQNRNRMFKRLKEFVRESVGPQAEAMVLTYNRSLKVKQRFTSDVDDVLGAIENTELDTGGGTTLWSDRRDNLRRIDESRSPTEALQIARMHSRSLRNDLEFAVDAIKNTLNGLAGVEGRKVFVYVSEGLPATAGAEMFDAVTQKFREGGVSTLEQFEFDMNTRYASIVQAANANGVTLWPLDATGLAVDDLVSAENRTMEARPNSFMMRQNSQAPLLMMAEQTGGIAAVNTNDWKRNLDELAHDFSDFYSIGYRSGRAAVDRPHRVEVNVKRKGLKVRARKGYLEKTVETRTAEAVEASLYYPREDNPLGITLTVGESRPYDRENYLLPIHVSIPLSKMALVPSGDMYQGNYFLYLKILDVSGKTSDMQIQRGTVSVPQKELDNAQKKNWGHPMQLIVVAGGQKIAVGVRDGVSNQTSYVQKNVFVSVLPKEAGRGE